MSSLSSSYYPNRRKAREVLASIYTSIYGRKIMNNYREKIINALIKFYEGGIAAHIVNIEVLVGSHVGLAEHGDIIETVDLELEKLAALEDKLASLKRHFK
tara:strand:- start:203 stop:505 length:303 start_codon:yes stop_codon:yes gene_type:complete